MQGTCGRANLPIGRQAPTVSRQHAELELLDQRRSSSFLAGPSLTARCWDERPDMVQARASCYGGRWSVAAARALTVRAAVHG